MCRSPRCVGSEENGPFTLDNDVDAEPPLGADKGTQHMATDLRHRVPLASTTAGTKAASIAQTSRPRQCQRTRGFGYATAPSHACPAAHDFDVDLVFRTAGPCLLRRGGYYRRGPELLLSGYG